ncbi:hypothetical protein ACLB1S_17625 [Escherichia coli]
MKPEPMTKLPLTVLKMTSEMQQGEWVSVTAERYRRGELCCQRQKRRFNQCRSERSD